ncbi:MAG TPA: hypothetical protein VHW09_03840 [Bryobacteraceae bacterium]|jgi:hypothetical protein|nr:hypothetical protein [Bryobacteraceae bacterium]
MTWVRQSVFRLYEQRTLRNWFYTIAFAIFVPIGYRFADLAWRYGSWIDKPLAIVAGFFIGVATVVTLLRIWHVPPTQTAASVEPPAVVSPQPVRSVADEVRAAARSRAARNRDLALHAAALGSSTGAHWH